MTSKNFCITLRSGSDAPYTGKPQIKLGKTKEVNK